MLINFGFYLQNMLVKSHSGATDTVCDNRILRYFFPQHQTKGEIILYSF